MSYAQSDAAAPAQQPSQQQPTGAPPAAVRQPILQVEPYKADCENPKDHDAADLCEQQRMAKAAEEAVWWARLQTWLGGFGFAAVVLTLIFSGIAAISSSRQVRLSRHALVDTDRAFVFPKQTIWKAVRTAKSDKIESWRIAVEWENLGNTPTRYLRWHVNYSIRDDVLSEDFDFPNGNMDPPIPLVIAPGRTLESSELPITLEQMEAILDGRSHLYVWGWAEYDDVFERTPRHRTEFCHKWLLGGNVRNPERLTQRYNVHHRHNGADEECEKPIETASLKDMGR